jgi:ABC-2 type transport system ATP-binding protein
MGTNESGPVFSSEPVLKLDRVSKRFGRTVALDGVSFEVPRGSVCALLGANGAGKSTALRIMLGLLEPDAGSASILGMNSRTDGLAIRQRVGYVSDRPALYEWMTVDEIGWFASGFYPVGFLDEYRASLATLGVEGRARIKTLSKGSRSKVALALTLAHRPDVLILDEPTSGLDPLIRREFLESLVDVAAQDRTVLVSTHQVSDVERVADRVAILIRGQLVCAESLETLKASLREVVISGTDELPEIPGQVLSSRTMERQRVLLVRDLDANLLEERLPENLHAEIRQPDLEEILLALLREDRQAGTRTTLQPVPELGGAVS